MVIDPRWPRSQAHPIRPHALKLLGAIVVNVIALLLCWIGIPMLLWILAAGAGS